MGIQYHKTMRVTIVSKDALARDGLSSILVQEGQFAFAGASESVQSAVSLLGSASGAALVATDDLGKSDWSALAKAKESLGFKIIAIVSGASAAISKAADVVVQRTDGSKALVTALKKLAVDAPSSRAVADALQVRYGGKRLSKRELQVAQLVAQGMGNRRISQVVDIKEQSVKNLVSCIMSKLGCDNRTQVALALLGKEKG